MQTEIIKITDKNKEQALKKAANILKNGGLVVFPTETVYGLGASIGDEKALKNIFVAKGRPSDNPIIVHISEQSQLEELAESISELQQKIINAFWPGPLTIILEKKKEVSNILSGGLPTIAVRMPSHPIAQELIKKAGVPIAAPSANTSGRPSGTTGEHVYEDLIGKVDLIIDDGESHIGLESTVVKIDKDKILILRPGMITKEMLEKVIYPMPVVFAKDKNDLESSPGTRYKHYAPEGKLEIIFAPENEIGKEIANRASVLPKEKKVGIIGTKQNEDNYKKYKSNVFILGDRNNLEEISHNIYKALRFFDAQKVDVILSESFPEEGLGVAIMDRLKRAAGN